MTQLLREYIFVLLAAGVGVLIGCIGLVVGKRVRPPSRSSDAAGTYESGVDPIETGWQRPQQRYYLIALLFLVFDVEIAFIVPWALNAETFSTFGLVEMFVFVVVLLAGLGYAWRKGDLEWH